MKTAVLLMAYGGPDSLDELEPYLLDVRGGRPLTPEALEAAKARYARIGGRSPLLSITTAQARALELHLQAVVGEAAGLPEGLPQARLLKDAGVYVGMRHWAPYIKDTVAQIAADGYRRIIAICMAPHASRMSTGAYRQKLDEAVAAAGVPIEVAFVESWHDHPLFIRALEEKAREAWQRFPAGERDSVRFLFTAHSLPAVIQDQGDPYASQLSQTARLLAARLGLPESRWQLVYQCAPAGAGRWLGPQVCEVLEGLPAQGVKNLLVTPIGFVAEHVEILYDLDIEAREEAEACGIRFERSPALNTSPLLVGALAHLALDAAKSFTAAES